MKKYIKVEWWQAQKYQDESWYKEQCYEWFNSNGLYNDSVTFIPEDIYNQYFKDEDTK